VLLTALAAGYGTFLLYTALVFGWRGLRPAPPADRTPSPLDTRRVEEWLVQAGLAEVGRRELLAVLAAVVLMGGLAGTAVFGPGLAAFSMGLLAGALPLASYRARRERRLAQALDGWPRLIEEIRVLTAASGLSVPNALFAAGRRGAELHRSAFAAAEREWLVTTDLGRAATVLKDALADPTADTVCETLLVAHEVGGTDLDLRLAALAEDRVLDVQGRKDAAARQAGARFARRFVLVVPIGMALAGLCIGDGRAAYGTRFGQVMVAVGLAMVGVCWLWAGRLLALPHEERVFR
jgi:tight adherence protein B